MSKTFKAWEKVMLTSIASEESAVRFLKMEISDRQKFIQTMKRTLNAARLDHAKTKTP